VKGRRGRGEAASTGGHFRSAASVRSVSGIGRRCRNTRQEAEKSRADGERERRRKPIRLFLSNLATNPKSRGGGSERDRGRRSRLSTAKRRRQSQQGEERGPRVKEKTNHEQLRRVANEELCGSRTRQTSVSTCSYTRGAAREVVNEAKTNAPFPSRTLPNNTPTRPSSP
jgi:hypothetical protein